MCTESVHVYTQRPIETRQVYKLWILSDRDYDVARTKDKISKHCIPVIRSYFLDSTQRADIFSGTLLPSLSTAQGVPGDGRFRDGFQRGVLPTVPGTYCQVPGARYCQVPGA